MNTTEISNAQLSVSSHYTTHTISRLIDRLNQNGFIAYYNSETKSIDIEPGDIANNNSHILTIKDELKNWIAEFPIDSNTSIIIRDNIDFIYNITL